MHIMKLLMEYESATMMERGHVYWLRCAQYLGYGLFRNSLRVRELEPLFTQALLNFLVDTMPLEGEPVATNHKLRLIHYTGNCLLSCAKNTDLFNIFVSTVTWYDLEPSIRFKQIALHWNMGGGDVLRMLVRSSGTITADDFRQWSEDGAPLINLVLYCIGREIREEPQYELHGAWKSLIQEVMVAGGDSSIDPRGISLFRGHTYSWEAPDGSFSALNAFFLGANDDHLRSRVRFLERVQNTLHGILRVLKECGINLSGMGRKEAKILAASLLVKVEPKRWYSCTISWGRYGRFRQQNMYLSAIIYGPEPEHWRLKWESCQVEDRHDSEVHHGEFWRLIETTELSSPLLSIPGAWPEGC